MSPSSSLLQRQADGTGVSLVLPFRAVGVNDDGSPQIAGLEPLALTRGESDTAAGTDFSVELRGFQDFTLLIAKRDPGQGLVWLAAGCLGRRAADHVLDAPPPGVGQGQRGWASRADGPRGSLRRRDAGVRLGPRRPGQGATFGICRRGRARPPDRPGSPPVPPPPP